MDWLVSYVLLGAIVGVFSGLLGIGGGGIIVPVLTTLFLHQGYSPDEAVQSALGTSMASIILTSYSSFQAHNRRTAVLWDAVRNMLPGVIIGTFAATFVAANTPSLYLSVFFAGFMTMIAIRMFTSTTALPGRTLPGIWTMGLAGLGIGSLSAMVSIGGGSLSVPFLLRHGIDMRQAIGTSAAIGFPLSIAGTLGFVVNGDTASAVQGQLLGLVNLSAALSIGVASFLTAPLGTRLAHVIPVLWLKKAFGLLLILLSVKMIFAVT